MVGVERSDPCVGPRQGLEVGTPFQSFVLALEAMWDKEIGRAHV